MELRFDHVENPDLTDLPAFNELASDLGRYLDGQGHPEPVLESLARLDLVLGRMHAEFSEGLAFREDTPVAREAVPQVEEAFDWLRRSLPALHEALERNDPGTLLEVLEEARDAVQGACRGLARLRVEDEARERLSESRYVDELVRVGRAWLRGRLPQESFRLRLEGFEEYHRSLREGLQGFEPLPRERAVLEAGRHRLASALERQERALAELRTALAMGDEEPVAPALEAILGAAADMVELHRALVEASERDEERPCPRCGRANPLSARFCGGCQGVLPRMAPEEQPETARLDLVDDGGGSRPQYEHLVRLAQAVEGFRAGTVEGSALGTVLDDMEARLTQAASRLARVDPPSTSTPPEQMELYRAARRAAEDGQARLRDGLHRIREGMAERSSPALVDGLELVQAAALPMAEFERLYQEALAMAGP